MCCYKLLVMYRSKFTQVMYLRSVLGLHFYFTTGKYWLVFLYYTYLTTIVTDYASYQEVL